MKLKLNLLEGKSEGLFKLNGLQRTSSNVIPKKLE